MNVNNAVDDRITYRHCKKRETKAGENRGTYIQTLHAEKNTRM